MNKQKETQEVPDVCASPSWARETNTPRTPRPPSQMTRPHAPPRHAICARSPADQRIHQQPSVRLVLQRLAIQRDGLGLLLQHLAGARPRPRRGRRVVPGRCLGRPPQRVEGRRPNGLRFGARRGPRGGRARLECRGGGGRRGRRRRRRRPSPVRHPPSTPLPPSGTTVRGGDDGSRSRPPLRGTLTTPTRTRLSTRMPCSPPTPTWRRT